MDLDGAANYTARFASRLSHSGDIFAGVHICLTVLLTVVGNSLVVVTTFQSRPLKSIDKLIVNIAVSDLVTALFGYPLAICSSFYHGWVWGDLGCHWYGWICFTGATVSMTSFAFVAYFRYSKLVKTLDENTFRRRVNFAVIFSWIYSIVWTSFPFVSWGKYAPEPFHTSCTVDWASRAPNVQSYVLAIVISTFLLPLCVAVFCYMSIGRKLLSHQMQLGLGHGSSSTSSARFRNENRLMMTSLVTTICFAVSWTPYAVIAVTLMLVGGDETISPVASFLPTMFAKTSTLYNPVIYLVFNKKFRDQARKLLLRCGCKVFNYKLNISPESKEVHSAGVRLFLFGKTYKVKYGRPVLINVNQQRNVEEIPMRGLRGDRAGGGVPFNISGQVPAGALEAREPVIGGSGSQICRLRCSTAWVGGNGQGPSTSRIAPTCARGPIPEQPEHPFQVDQKNKSLSTPLLDTVVVHPFGNSEPD